MNSQQEFFASLTKPELIDNLASALKTIEELQADLDDLQKHFDNLYNVKLNMQQRKEKIKAADRPNGCLIVSCKVLRSSALAGSTQKRADVIEIIVETPWPNNTPYETINKLFAIYAEKIAAGFGYTRYLSGPWKGKSLSDHFDTSEPTAYYPTLVYNCKKNYQISFLANCWPTKGYLHQES